MGDSSTLDPRWASAVQRKNRSSWEITDGRGERGAGQREETVKRAKQKRDEKISWRRLKGREILKARGGGEEEEEE